MTDADLVFDPDVRLAHLKPYGDEHVLCGSTSSRGHWWGTGSWAEEETASRMDRCHECTERARELLIQSAVRPVLDGNPMEPWEWED